MLLNNHNIHLTVNGKIVDLSKEGTDIVIDLTLFSPELLSSTETEFSYSFSLPATKTNNAILNFGNALDKPNRFRGQFNAILYADEVEIFNGQLIINGFQNNEYQCNLVSPKVYNLEDIFGDATLYDIGNWYLPFDGISSINAYNASGSTDVTFPLVSYGVFQKSPYFSDSVANDYTDKFTFDKYNKWWVESFYPSLNMLSVIKHAFEWKGYIVDGDAFSDVNLKSIFLSTNLSDEQIPVYNLGNERFGKLELSAIVTAGTDNGYEQELNFPYFKVSNGSGNFVGGNSVAAQTVTTEAWNFPSIRLYDILGNGNVTVNNPSYLFDPGEKCIVIPADGFYKIYLHSETQLDYSNTALTAAQNVFTIGDAGKTDIGEEDVTMTIGMNEVTPVEIQLVRNYNDNIELIKGKYNKKYYNGNPTEEQYQVNSRYYQNSTSWLTCFPHEDPYASVLPTKQNDLSLRNAKSQFGGARSSNSEGSGRIGGSRTNPTTTSRQYSSDVYGYVYKDYNLMAYDPVVSSDFICGFSSIGQCPAVIKNGHSWTASYAEEHDSYYDIAGYNKLYRNQGTDATIQESATTFNHNAYPSAPLTYFSVGKRTIDGKQIMTSMYGTLYACVYLHKNDILELFEVHRAYRTKRGLTVNYKATTTIDLRIEAASPKSKEYLDYEGWKYNSPSEFDVNLRIPNFLSNETKVSDYIQSVLDAFNLQMAQTGKSISINKRKNPLISKYPPVINLDNRVKSSDAESESVDYPSSIAVKYKIDTDEWGFETTVPKEKLNDEDWKDYGDSGFSAVQIDGNVYNVNDEEKSLNFSYTWYDNFKWIETNADNEENTGNTINLNIPVLSNFQWMIPTSSNYDEAMQHDGYGLTQRMWFKPKKTDAFVWTDSYPSEKADIFIPSNDNGNLKLNYKNEEKSILRNYFNSQMNAANSAVKIKCYLSIDEYNLIKKGCRVKFDDTVYIPMSINYRVDGDEESELMLLKI